MTFDQFWEIYPRRVGKGCARRAWDKALHLASPEDILLGVKRYASECSGKELRYVAHPATWLNGERWADEPGANQGSKLVAATEVAQGRPWAQILTTYKPGGFWPSTWGERPEKSGPHDCPSNLVNEWRKQQGLPILDKGGNPVSMLGAVSV